MLESAVGPSSILKDRRGDCDLTASAGFIVSAAERTGSEFIFIFMYYILYLPCRRLASGEGIVTLGVCVCVRQAATARPLVSAAKGNALYIQCCL